MIYTPLRDGRAVEQGSQGGERAGVTWRGSWAFAGWGTENLGTPHLKTAGLSPHARLRQLPPLRLPRPFGHPLPSPVLDEDAPHAALVSPRSSLHVLSSFPWGARALSRCQADAGLSCFLGLARGTARQLLVLRFMPLGGREQAAALDRWGSGSTEKEGDFPKVTRPPGPSPPPASPPPFKGMPGPGTHAGGLAGAEAGWGESRSPTPPGPLSCRALTRLPGPRQDGRYGGSSPLLLTAPASVCPSVKGVGFRETFWEGLKEALGLSEGACLGASSILLRPLTGCATSRLILEATRLP